MKVKVPLHFKGIHMHQTYVHLIQSCIYADTCIHLYVCCIIKGSIA